MEIRKWKNVQEQEWRNIFSWGRLERKEATLNVEKPNRAIKVIFHIRSILLVCNNLIHIFKSLQAETADTDLAVNDLLRKRLGVALLSPQPVYDES